jgi:hypothetical protein
MIRKSIKRINGRKANKLPKFRRRTINKSLIYKKVFIIKYNNKNIINIYKNNKY